MDNEGNYAVYGGNGINGRHSAFMFDQPVLVIGRVGVYCGAIHITEPKSWVTDNALYVAEKDRRLNETYLEWALRLANLNQYANQAAQPLISGSRIYPVSICVPETTSQEQFACTVKRQTDFVGRITDTFQKSDDLFNSLVQRAFRGEL